MSQDAIGTTTRSASSLNETETILRLAEAFQAFGPLYKRWVHGRIKSEVGFTHQRALDELGGHGPMIMNALGSELGVTARYVTALVDSLEADGLVSRSPQPGDRRATLIELTDKGQAAFAATSSVFERSFVELVSVLSQEQREGLLRCLDLLLAELRRRAAHAEPPSAA